jgi:hypothetical protein
MRRRKRQPKERSQRARIFPREEYAPVEEWSEANGYYQDKPLKEGECTKIIDSTNGQGICILARFKNLLRSHPYLNGVKFKTDLIEVSPMEIHEREEENKKFL